MPAAAEPDRSFFDATACDPPLKSVRAGSSYGVNNLLRGLPARPAVRIGGSRRCLWTADPTRPVSGTATAPRAHARHCVHGPDALSLRRDARGIRISIQNSRQAHAVDGLLSELVDAVHPDAPLKRASHDETRRSRAPGHLLRGPEPDTGRRHRDCRQRTSIHSTYTARRCTWFAKTLASENPRSPTISGTRSSRSRW
jgi:hypothetical protein